MTWFLKPHFQGISNFNFLGHVWLVPEAAVEAGELHGRRRQGQVPGDFPAAAVVRSLLLLHLHLHEGPHRLPRQSTRTHTQASLNFQLKRNMKIDQVERFLTVIEMPHCFKKAYHDVKILPFLLAVFLKWINIFTVLIFSTNFFSSIAF